MLVIIKKSEMTMNITKLIRFSVFMACTVTFAACGKAGDLNKESKVAAKVDGEQITVPQLEFALSQIGATDEARVKQVQAQTLNALIEQRLAVKKALEQKLDQEPRVIQAIESARRQVLAQAFLENALKQIAKPTPEEIKDYFGKHPELFEKRRIYRLQEMRVSAKPDQIDSVKAELTKAHSMNDLIVWLKSQNIPYTGSVTIKAAEDIPAALIAKLNAMKEGQSIAVPTQNMLQIIQLLASQEQPVTEIQATPAITAFLLNNKRSEVAQAEIKKLRDAAKVEYVGDFANGAEQGKAAPEKSMAPAKSEPSSLEKGLFGPK
jgi:EpsD family peptidyl-prolyl cis-trans isomerase